MTMRARFSGQPWSAILALTTLYGVAFAAGYEFVVPGNTAVVWPARGVALATILILPRSAWTAAITSLAAVNLAGNLYIEHSSAEGVWYFLANGVELFVDALVFSIRLRGPVTFRRVSDVVRLIIAATLANACATLVGAATIFFYAGTSFWAAALSWWTADALGILLVTPLLVSWVDELVARRAITVSYRLEAFAFLIMWSAASIVTTPWIISRHALQVLEPFLLIGLLVWAALRLGLPIVTLAFAGLAATITMRLWEGVPTVAAQGETVPVSFLLAQAYLGLTSAVGLLLVANRQEAGAAITAAREERARLRALTDHLPDAAIFQFEVKDDVPRMRFVSAGAELVLGITEADAMADVNAITRFVVDEDRERLVMARRMSQQTLKPMRVEVRLRTADGSLRWVQLSASPRRGDGEGVLFDGLARDVTERYQSEVLLQRANRALQTTTYGSEVMVRAQTEEDLLRDVCRVIVEVGGYLMAWVGYAIDDPEKSVRPVAATGIDIEALMDMKVSWGDTERGRGPSGTAVRTGVMQISHHLLDDPKMAVWHHEALARGYRSSISFPLRVDGGVVGVLSVYSGDIDAFNDEETALLRQLADDLAYGIGALRARVERDQADSQRTRLLAQLGERIRELRALQAAGALLRESRPLDPALLVRLANLLPPAYQYPEVCEARIQFAGMTATTPGWRATPWMQTQSFRVSAEEEGLLDVSYLEERPLEAEGPFLAEERDLLVALGDMLTAHVRRQRAEEALRGSEARFRELAENIREVFWLIDARTSILLYVSPAYRRIWGRDPDELYRSPLAWLESVHVDDRPSVEAATAARALGQAYDVAYRVVRSDGDIRWVHDRAFPVLDAFGRVYRFAGVTEDITERKAAEGRVIQAQKMEAVGRLAGGVAHDFNNLLTVINGFSEVLLADAPDDRTRSILEQIHGAGTRASALTRRLLAFSRQPVLETRVLDLNVVVRDCEKMLRRLLRDDTDQLLLLLDADLQHIDGDPLQIERALVNLVINARDASPRGGMIVVRTANVEILEGAPGSDRAGKAGSYVTLSVSDSGTGMSADVKARMFEPFFTTKPEGKGTGLGLSVVDGVVRQSGGFVEVDTAAGMGATFRLFLPAIADEVVEPPRPAPDVPTAGRATVPVVEDDTAVRQFVELVLSERYVVLTADGGEEAIRIVDQATQPIDLLISDVVMPGMTGPEVVERLGPRVKHALLMSGFAPDALMNRGLAAEVEVLRKPFSGEDLLARVRVLLDR